MRISTRLVSALFSAILPLTFVFTASAQQTLNVGISSEPYPPFTYKASNGEWTGFEVDLALAICEAAEKECAIHPTAWAGIIPALNSGKIDMIVNSMSVTNKRERLVNFTRPYFFAKWAYVGFKNIEISIPSGLNGKYLGVQSATTQAKYVRTQLPQTGVRIKYYPKQEQLNRDLLAHRIDLLIENSVAAHGLVQRDDASDLEIKNIFMPYKNPIAIAVRKTDDKLLGDFNLAITSVIADGACEILSEKYFGFNICAEE